QNLASGMAAEEARYAARRQFGNQTWLKEVSREMWSLNSIETLIQDLRYGVRTLMKAPNYTLIAVMTLALGIGANTVIFSVVNGVLLRPLPFEDPERLIKIWETFPPGGQGMASVPDLKDWREQNTVFTGIAAYQFSSFNLRGQDSPERLSGATVSPNFFDVVGARPQLGRAFQIGQYEAGPHPRGAAEPPAVAARLRRRRECGRQGDSAQWGELHGHRRDAAGVSVSFTPDRALGPAGHSATSGGQQPQQPLAHHAGAVEAGCGLRAGARTDGGHRQTS